jgi:hypothetical protein
MSAHHQVPLVAEGHPGRAPQGHTERAQALGQPAGASGPGSGHCGQAFGAEAAPTLGLLTEPLPPPERQAHGGMCPGQVGERACVTAGDAYGRGGAERTGHAGLRGAPAQGELPGAGIDVARLKAQGGSSGEQVGKDVVRQRGSAIARESD